MEFNHKISNTILHVKLTGELDHHTASKLKLKLDQIFATSKFSKVVINMSELDFMDSTGVGFLMGRYKDLKKLNINIYISEPSRQIDKLLQVSGLYNIIPKI